MVDDYLKRIWKGSGRVLMTVTIPTFAKREVT
jgi:hypothetical protein